MRFIGKKILIISPEPWNHIFVSKHHYAVHLAKRGNVVFFLEPPTTLLSLRSTEYENIFVINYPAFTKGLRFLPNFLQVRLMRQKYNALQELVRQKFDIVWSFDNSVFYDFKALPSSVLKISHIVDLNQNFQTKKAAKTATLCLCTTELILQRLSRYNKRAHKINHGFNIVKVNEEIELPGMNRIKAIYCGNLNMPFIDWEILFEAAKDSSEVDFVFIGPDSDLTNVNYNRTASFKRKIYHLKNVHFVGKVRADRIPFYLASADFLLVAYQEAFHKDQANPHKMMEYLGSGKTIVSTYTREYISQRHLLNMVDSNKDFLKAVKVTAENLQTWNNLDKRLARMDFALSNSYENQISKIETLLTEQN